MIQTEHNPAALEWWKSLPFDTQYKLASPYMKANETRGISTKEIERIWKEKVGQKEDQKGVLKPQIESYIKDTQNLIAFNYLLELIYNSRRCKKDLKQKLDQVYIKLHFEYGFGGSHLWVFEKGQDQRLLMVEL